MGHAAAPDAAQRRGSTAGGGAREHGARAESDRATRVAGYQLGDVLVNQAWHHWLGEHGQEKQFLMRLSGVVQFLHAFSLMLQEVPVPKGFISQL